MDKDSYKIIVSLSHHRISYEYWQRDAEDRLVPILGGVWPAPLAFYCLNNRIIIGEEAERAVRAGMNNAFGNYFEILKDNLEYTRGGRRQPFKNLLLDASESLFDDFFRETLLNSEGTLNDNRAKMPLTLVCESDVKPYERAFLMKLFKESGYARVNVLEYNQYIHKYINEQLSRDYVCDKVLVAWTEGKDLTFTLYNVGDEEVRVQKTYAGLGVDPRKEYVKGLIWQDILNQDQFVLRNRMVEEALEKAATDFFLTTAPLVRGKIILSGGDEFDYSLTRIDIDCLHRNDNVSLWATLDSFLRENGIENRSRLVLLLRGGAAGNTYFENNLNQGFAAVIKSDSRLREQTMKRVLDCHQTIIKDGPPPPDGDDTTKPMTDLKRLNRRWREVKAEAKGKARIGQTMVAQQILKDFLSECEAVSGTEAICSEIRAEIAKYATTDENNHQVKKPAISWSRRWREVKAEANGKRDKGNIAEACGLVEAFLSEIRGVPGTQEQETAAKAMLAELTENSSGTKRAKRKDGDLHANDKQESSVAGGKNDWRTTGGRVHTETLKQPKEQEGKRKTTAPKKPGPPKPSADKGKALLREGKAQEARVWYREQGDTDMDKALTKIIRSQREVETRKKGLEDCQKNKDKLQISRIIKEISDFIAMCDTVSLNAAEYKKLLTEYKKIK